MTVSKHEISAVVAVGAGITLDVIDARVALDDAWTPYIQAELTCWTPDEEDLELLDPREQLRVTLTLTKAQAAYNPGQLVDQERTLDLLLRGRQVDHETGTMTVTLESDEALLIDSALVATTPDGSAEDHQESLRGIVGGVLDEFDAELEAGTADAAFLVADNATNIIQNPSAEDDLTGWSARNGDGVLTPTRETATPPAGWPAYVHTVAGTSGVSYLDIRYGEVGAEVAVTAGREYTCSALFRTNRNDLIARTYIQWIDESDTILLTVNDVHTLDTSASAGWVRYRMAPRTAPEGAVTVQFVFRIMPSAQQLTSTTTLDIAGFQFVDSTTNILKRQPGVTAWDFLEPLLQTAGLRLYCTEDRSWILEPSGTARDGQINIAAGSNVTRGRDQISRQEQWYDSVVIAYTRALDEAGQETTAYDAAGAPGSKTLVLSYERPYPGAGAAQAVLDRAQGRGRVLELEAISDYTATPGMTLSASLPASPIQTGAISSVEWRLPEGRMTIGSRGLTDTPVTAWQLAAANLAWEDIASGVDWTEYEPS